jgi:hypothetical protein
MQLTCCSEAKRPAAASLQGRRRALGVVSHSQSSRIVIYRRFVDSLAMTFGTVSKPPVDR